MARKQKTKENLGPYYSLFTLLLLTFALLFSFRVYKLVRHELMSVVETPKTETKRIPREVKMNLKPDYNPSYKVPILLYHYVEYVSDRNDRIRQSLNIEPNIFEEQVRTLNQNGYTFMTAKELGDVIDGDKPLPKKPVLLTFDDGHWDLDTVILPILKKYNAKATAYVIPGFLNQSDFLTDAQLNDIIKSRLVDVGAHTVHHVYLKGLILPIAKYEIDESKAMLENNFHIKVYSFAYPDGAFDEQAINLAKKAGFSTAVTTIPGIVQSGQNKYFLFRLRPGYRTGQDLLNYFDQTTFKPY